MPEVNQPEGVPPVASAVPNGQLPPTLPGQPDPEYLVLQWEADSRVARKRSREYYSSLAVIVLLFSLILFFAGQTLLIFVLVSFLFVTYVLASVKAERITNQITTYGIRYGGQLFQWNQLGRFWLRDNHGRQEIHIEAPAFLSNEIILLAGDDHDNPNQVTTAMIVDIVNRYLPYGEPIPSRVDKWVKWLEEKFPLESRTPGKPRS